MAQLNSAWFHLPAPRVVAGREAQYIEFEENWLRELAPEGPLEMDAFQDFLRSAWRKREVLEAQNELGASFHDEGPAAKTFDRLLRHEREFESRCDRALNRLRKLQITRKRQAKAAEPAKPATILETFPDNVARTLYLMDTESRFLNARLRAQKAGLAEPPLFRLAEAEERRVGPEVDA